jgi:large subunit ribosomal protein L10
MSNKEETVADLVEQFQQSSAVLLTEYRGLSVAQLKQLRRSLQEDASYAVVKNTLTKIAAEKAGISAFAGMFSGPSAIAFVHGDAVSVARGLKDFSSENPELVIKAGYFDGAPISRDEIMHLASLETREVLLGQLARAFKAAMYGAAVLVNAPLISAVRTVDAHRQKQESDS